MSKTVKARIQLRRDTAANWEAKNEVLLDGEKVVVVTAAGQTRFKVGDGTKTFKQLPFTDEVLNEAISKKADASAVPTKVSELENDAGYLTGYTETDPTVPAWAKAASKPTYTAGEVGARPSSWVPTQTQVTVSAATDYTTNRVRGIALYQDSAPSSIPNGCIVGVYELA